jgi:hypothetical protein
MCDGRSYPQKGTNNYRKKDIGSYIGLCDQMTVEDSQKFVGAATE